MDIFTDPDSDRDYSHSRIDDLWEDTEPVSETQLFNADTVQQLIKSRSSENKRKPKKLHNKKLSNLLGHHIQKKKEKHRKSLNTKPNEPIIHPIEQKEQSVNEYKYEEDEEKQNNEFTETEFQIKNYSTLRTNLQWNEHILQNAMERLSSIKILPPNMSTNDTNTFKTHGLLKKTYEQLENPSTTVENDCHRIVKYVMDKGLDPMFTDDNPFRNPIQHELQHSIHPMLDNVSSVIVHKPVINPLQHTCGKRFVEQLNYKKNGNTYLPISDKIQRVKKMWLYWEKNQMKKSIKFTYQMSSRCFSLLDIITDSILLYKASRVDDGQLLYLVMALLISMASPYIISRTGERWKRNGKRELVYIIE